MRLSAHPQACPSKLSDFECKHLAKPHKYHFEAPFLKVSHFPLHVDFKRDLYILHKIISSAVIFLIKVFSQVVAYSIHYY